MDYEVKLRIDYHYASPAIGGRHLVCLAPLPQEAGQTVRAANVAMRACSRTQSMSVRSAAINWSRPVANPEPGTCASG